jgi:hypothetical protein
VSGKVPLWFICAPFPKSGASTFTRLLVDYHLFNRRSFSLFDTDVHGQTLEQFFPDIAQTIDLATTPGQIALFDKLLEAGTQARIVEICAPAHQLFLVQARDIGFFEESEKNGFEPAILFISNGKRAAIEAGTRLQTIWRRVPVIPVVNEGFVRLGSKINDHLDAFPVGRSFQVPPMEPMLQSTIAQPDFSLSDFLRQPPAADEMSLVVRADLRSWITRVFTQLRSHELRKAMDESVYLMKA